MSYYWFNRKDLLKKTHKSNIKKVVRAGEYYQRNKETLKNKARNKYKI